MSAKPSSTESPTTPFLSLPARFRRTASTIALRDGGTALRLPAAPPIRGRNNKTDQIDPYEDDDIAEGFPLPDPEEAATPSGHSTPRSQARAHHNTSVARTSNLLSPPTVLNLPSPPRPLIDQAVNRLHNPTTRSLKSPSERPPFSRPGGVRQKPTLSQQSLAAHAGSKAIDRSRATNSSTTPAFESSSSNSNWSRRRKLVSPEELMASLGEVSSDLKNNEGCLAAKRCPNDVDGISSSVYTVTEDIHTVGVDRLGRAAEVELKEVIRPNSSFDVPPECQQEALTALIESSLEDIYGSGSSTQKQQQQQPFGSLSMVIEGSNSGSSTTEAEKVVQRRQCPPSDDGGSVEEEKEDEVEGENAEESVESEEGEEDEEGRGDEQGIGTTHRRDDCPEADAADEAVDVDAIVAETKSRPTTKQHDNNGGQPISEARNRLDSLLETIHSDLQSVDEDVPKLLSRLERLEADILTSSTSALAHLLISGGSSGGDLDRIMTTTHESS